MNTLLHSTGSIPSRGFPCIPAGSVTKSTTLVGSIKFEGVGAAWGVHERL
jgi:hypothetical protein